MDNTQQGNNTGTKTFVQQVLGELSQNLTASMSTAHSLVRTGSSRALTQSDVTALVAAATAQITQDGFAQSTALDKILPSMLAGVQQGLQDASLTADTAATVLSVSTKSAIGSLGASGREANYSAGVTVDATVSVVAETSTKAILASITNPELKKTALSSAMSEAAKAIDAASGISPELAGKAITSLVQGSVKAAMANTDALELVKTINTQVTAATAGMVKITDKSALVNETVTAAVTAVASFSTNATTAADIIKQTIAGAAQSAGVTLDTAAIALAISVAAQANTLITVTITVTDISNVVAENLPTITSASASPSSVTAANTDITLIVSAIAGTPFTGVAYAWTCIQPSGLKTVVPASTDGTAYFTITDPGTYTFQVTVRNKNGYKEATQGGMSVTATFTVAALQEAINAGIRALKMNDYDAALTSFTLAAAMPSTTSEALFWKAFMDLMSVSVDPGIVSMMRDRIGMLDYPSSMTALFSTTWMNGNWYSSPYTLVPVANPATNGYYYIKGTFTPDPSYPGFQTINTISSSGSGYGTMTQYSWQQGYFTPSDTGDVWVSSFYTSDKVSHTSSDAAYSSLTKYTWGYLLDLTRPTLLPRMQVPTWASSFIGKGVPGEDANHLAAYKFPFVIGLNIIERNPAGFNAAIDALLAGAFGSRFTAAMEGISSLPDSATIQIPNDLLAAYGAVPPSTVKIVIDKSQLLAFEAYMLTIKSFLQLLASYSFDYPAVSSMKVTYWDNTDANTNGMPDWADSLFANAPNPIKAGMFATRSQVTRDSSQTSMLSALDLLNTAITLFITNHPDLDTYLTDLSGSAPAAGTATKVSNALNGAKNSAAALRNAIAGGTALLVDMNALSNGTVWTDSVYQWPTASSSSTVTIYPQVFYTDADILDPAKTISTVLVASQPVGIKMFGAVKDAQGVVTSREELTDFATQGAKSYSELQFEVDWNRVKLVYDPGSTVTIPGLEGSKLYVGVMGSFGNPAPFSASMWELINWVRGN